MVECTENRELLLYTRILTKFIGLSLPQLIYSKNMMKITKNCLLLLKLSSSFNKHIKIIWLNSRSLNLNVILILTQKKEEKQPDAALISALLLLSLITLGIIVRFQKSPYQLSMKIIVKMILWSTSGKCNLM